MTIPVIDVKNTSLRLKTIREQKNIKISQLQALFGMENPQSIYNWENPQKKNLPRIDNLVILAKTYNVRLDELIILKEEKTDYLPVCDYSPEFITKSTLDFIREASSQKSKEALSRYYQINLLSY